MVVVYWDLPSVSQGPRTKGWRCKKRTGSGSVHVWCPDLRVTKTGLSGKRVRVWVGQGAPQKLVVEADVGSWA